MAGDFSYMGNLHFISLFFFIAKYNKIQIIIPRIMDDETKEKERCNQLIDCR